MIAARKGNIIPNPKVERPEKKADTVEEAATDAAQDTWRLSDFSQVKGLYMFMASLCYKYESLHVFPAWKHFD